MAFLKDKDSEAYKIGLLLIAAFIYAFQLPILTLVEDNLDPSWRNVVRLLAEREESFHSLITFTYGPAAWTLIPYPEDLIPAILIYWLAFGACLLTLRQFLKRPAIIMLIIAAVIWPSQGNIFILTTLFGLSLIFHRKLDILKLLILGLMTFICHAKYSFLMPCLACCVIADLGFLARNYYLKDAPAWSWKSEATLKFTLFFLLWFTFFGVAWTDIPATLKGISEIVSGYSEAMLLYDNPLLPILFVLIIAGLVWLKTLMKMSPSADKVKVFMWGLFSLIISANIFMAFKSGYTRADQHVLRTWDYLLWLIFFFIAMAPLFTQGPRQFKTYKKTIIGLGILFVVGYLASGANIDLRKYPSLYRSGMTVIHPGFKSQSIQSIDQRHKEYRKSLGNDLLENTLDAYPYELSFLTGKGVKYHPRPVIQTYSAYTPFLQNLNAEHISENGADKILFFGFQTIDQRLPALLMGPSLTEILKWYDLDCDIYKHPNRDIEANILTRRNIQANISIENLSTSKTEINEWVSVEGLGPYPALTIKMERSIISKLVGFILKPNQTFIEVKYRNGTIQNYRFIPKAAENFFWLTPQNMKITNFYHADNETMNPAIAFRLKENSLFGHKKRFDLQKGSWNIIPLEHTDKCN